jgi:hypothetical protein
MFDFPTWCFHDVGLSHGDRSQQDGSPVEEDYLAQKDIYLGGFFLIASSAVHGFMLDNEGAVDSRPFLLSHSLASAGQRSFAKAFPPDSPFWSRYEGIFHDYIEHRLSPAYGVPTDDTPEAEWSSVGKRWVFSKIAPVASLMATNNMSRVDSLERFLDELNNLFQVQMDILNLKRDLVNGHTTYPIMRIVRAAGIEITKPLVPEKILGAILLFDPISDLLRDCFERLAWCRSLCRQGSFASFASLLDSWEASFGKLQGLFALRRKMPGEKERISEDHTSFIPDADAPLPLSIRTAQAYLLSDLTFRESWEVHRWGFLGKPVLTGRIFPSGLILYLLSNSGLDLHQQIDALFDQWDQQGCKYFEEPCALPPDADSAGLMMRLIRFSRSKSKYVQVLNLSIQRILANTSASAEIPTYLTVPAGQDREEHYFPHLFGNDCGTVRAMVLLGLTEYAYEGYGNLVSQAAGQLYESIVRFGSTLNVYYSHLYWVWMTCQLFVALRSKADPIGCSELSDEVAHILVEQAKKGIPKRGLRAQEAALLILIGLSDPCKSLVDPGWVEVVIHHQRYDGSWDDQPFYRVPTLNNRAGWYSSRLMTTALCCHALTMFRLKWKGFV